MSLRPTLVAVFVVVLVAEMIRAGATRAQTAGEIRREQSDLRTWTDITGKHKTDAAFLRFDGEKVWLKRKDGSNRPPA